jgi:mRNA interferase MazF
VLVTRGEVYWVTFDPTVGGEVNKTRPAIILSNNLANRVLNRVIMVPLTTNVERELPGEALVEINGKRHKALGSQIRTVSKMRVGRLFGELSAVDLDKVERAVLFQLGINITALQQ